jgi:hypothetical protein
MNYRNKRTEFDEGREKLAEGTNACFYFTPAYKVTSLPYLNKNENY